MRVLCLVGERTIKNCTLVGDISRGFESHLHSEGERKREWGFNGYKVKRRQNSEGKKRELLFSGFGVTYYYGTATVVV